MSRLTALLADIGLSQTESTVFDHLYHSGEQSASALSTTLSLNRATCYHALHTLTERSLISSEIRNGTKYFHVVQSDALLEHFDYEKEKLEYRKAEFKEYFAKHAPKSTHNEESTSLYTGEEGIRSALEKAFKCRSKTWHIIAPKHNFFTGTTEEFADYYLARRKKYKIRAKTLWESPKLDVPSVRKIIAEERAPRYLPKAILPFTSMVILYDASALFISSHQERSAILITSESIVSLLLMQFDALYKIATIPSIRESR